MGGPIKKRNDDSDSSPEIESAQNGSANGDSDRANCEATAKETFEVDSAVTAHEEVSGWVSSSLGANGRLRASRLDLEVGFDVLRSNLKEKKPIDGLDLDGIAHEDPKSHPAAARFQTNTTEDFADLDDDPTDLAYLGGLKNIRAERRKSTYNIVDMLKKLDADVDEGLIPNPLGTTKTSKPKKLFVNSTLGNEHDSSKYKSWWSGSPRTPRTPRKLKLLRLAGSPPSANSLFGRKSAGSFGGNSNTYPPETPPTPLTPPPLQPASLVPAPLKPTPRSSVRTSAAAEPPKRPPPPKFSLRLRKTAEERQRKIVHDSYESARVANSLRAFKPDGIEKALRKRLESGEEEIGVVHKIVQTPFRANGKPPMPLIHRDSSGKFIMPRRSAYEAAEKEATSASSPFPARVSTINENHVQAKDPAHAKDDTLSEDDVHIKDHVNTKYNVQVKDQVQTKEHAHIHAKDHAQAGSHDIHAKDHNQVKDYDMLPKDHVDATGHVQSSVCVQSKDHDILAKEPVQAKDHVQVKEPAITPTKRTATDKPILRKRSIIPLEAPGIDTLEPLVKVKTSPSAQKFKKWRDSAKSLLVNHRSESPGMPQDRPEDGFPSVRPKMIKPVVPQMEDMSITQLRVHFGISERKLAGKHDTQHPNHLCKWDTKNLWCTQCMLSPSFIEDIGELASKGKGKGKKANEPSSDLARAVPVKCERCQVACCVWAENQFYLHETTRKSVDPPAPGEQAGKAGDGAAELDASARATVVRARLNAYRVVKVIEGVCCNTGKEASSFVRCSDCGMLVCPGCAGRCAGELCGLIVCSVCHDNPVSNCFEHGGRTESEQGGERVGV